MSRVTYSSVSVSSVSSSGPDGDEPLQPELADVARLGRRLVDKTVRAARGGEDPLRRRLHNHLGAQAGSFPIVSGSWLPHDQVNVQIGLDEWLRSGGRSHQLIGITHFRHRDFALADLVQSGSTGSGLGIGNVATMQLPAGPGGLTRSCVKCGLYLVSEGQSRYAMLLRTPDDRGPMGEVSLEVVTADTGRAEQIVAEVRQLAVDHNVYRGQVISFGGEMFGHGRGGALSFLERPRTARDDVVLPEDTLGGVERQVLGVQRHVTRLRASGQHLKRGVLLYGAPGTGKTHTVGYLIGQMPAATVVILAGGALELIGQACSVARLLQPSVIVVEDVDLIAEQRGMHRGAHPLLFQLLNEMDGLGEDVDVTFLLTTNRADILETALAERPGRVDHAAELPLPDAAARRKLITLYQGSLALDLSDLATVIERTEGVTASFLKELLRKAALFAAEDGAEADQDGPLRVTDVHMTQALDQLLDTRNQLTQMLLGAQPRTRDSGAAGMDALIGEGRGPARVVRPPD
jgi:ATPase family associated with various cellular activities (AAA)